jgi:hypothetical protein
MAAVNTSSQKNSIFNLSHAKWVARVLGMLIAVVGRDSLLGIILRQTRSEIGSIVQDEEPSPAAAKAACFKNN